MIVVVLDLGPYLPTESPNYLSTSLNSDPNAPTIRDEGVCSQRKEEYPQYKANHLRHQHIQLFNHSQQVRKTLREGF